MKKIRLLQCTGIFTLFMIIGSTTCGYTIYDHLIEACPQTPVLTDNILSNEEIFRLHSNSVTQNIKPATSSVNNIIYVDDDNTEGPWDGTLEHPYKTIHIATYYANINDTVFVFNGSYTDGSISLYKPIRLIGEGKTNTIVNTMIFIYADWVSISGFTIQKVEGIRIYGNHTNLHDLIIKDHRTPGILIVDGFYNITISNCEITNNSAEGIWCTTSQVIIRDNFFNHNGGCDILVSVFCQGVSIYNNVIMSTLGLQGEKNIVMGNIFTECNYYAIILIDSNENIIQNNIFLNNKKTSIHLIRSSKNQFIGNSFINNSENAFFYYSGQNKWYNNYWDRPRILPKIIPGRIMLNEKDIPWINIDWRPARVPISLSLQIQNKKYIYLNE